MPTAIRTLDADDDLRNIAYAIGVESCRPATADQVIDELIDCCDQLAELSKVSRLGTSIPQLEEGVRAYSFKRWVIVFRYVEDGVTILRIVDGSRDYLKWKLDDV